MQCLPANPSSRCAIRAILRFYIYSGARIATGCRLKVSDFHQDGDEATLRFHLKGGRVKTKGIHFAAAEAIAEYIRSAGIESGRCSGLGLRRVPTN